MNRAEANQRALARLTEADPVLVGVAKARDVVPGMAPNVILTSGAPLPWDQYTGTQRSAILWGAVFEGLAGTAEEAAAKIERGEIVLGTTQQHSCVGVHAGIYTSSMSVLVVEDRATRTRGYCSFFEGDAQRRLGFGFYGPEVAEQLRFVEDVLAPTIGEAVKRSRGVPLQPIANRALQLGDEMHARTIGGTLLFTRALVPAFLDMAATRAEEVRRTLHFLETADHFFYRVWMAACKAMLDAASGIEGSSLVTAMVFNCREFGIRVSGLGDEWFRGPHQHFDEKLVGGRMVVPSGSFESGSDCAFSECVGLGAFASAAAFMLQGYQGVRPETMIERTLAMYDITLGEHPEYRIPFLNHRGVPVGIDLFKVLDAGVLPMFQGILVNPEGVVVGTAVARAPIECFEAASSAYKERYER